MVLIHSNRWIAPESTQPKLLSCPDYPGFPANYPVIQGHPSWLQRVGHFLLLTGEAGAKWSSIMYLVQGVEVLGTCVYARI